MASLSIFSLNCSLWVPEHVLYIQWIGMVWTLYQYSNVQIWMQIHHPFTLWCPLVGFPTIWWMGKTKTQLPRKKSGSQVWICILPQCLGIITYLVLWIWWICVVHNLKSISSLSHHYLSTTSFFLMWISARAF